MEITTHRNLNHKTCNTMCKICRAIYIDCQWGFGGAVVAFHLSEEHCFIQTLFEQFFIQTLTEK